MNRKLTTGYYTPTESFKSISEHIAVMFEDNQTLVAIVGASDNDPENLAETHEYAELFAAAPETLQKLSHALATIAARSAVIKKLTDALKESEAMLERSRRFVYSVTPAGVESQLCVDIENWRAKYDDELTIKAAK